ncbi:hypothetical protein D1007_07342 [Hordeum vulgare]|nr:hypothetical protein D1007_07342 [Hordeum vulgare]
MDSLASRSRAGSNNNDLESMMQELGLHEEDVEDAVVVEDDLLEDATRWMVVARVHTDRPYNQYWFYKNMRVAWDLAQEVKIRPFSDNLYTMQFSCLGDWERVVEGPSTFKGKVVIIVPYDGVTWPSTIALDKVDMWIQIHDLPDDLFQYIKPLAATVGEVLFAEPKSQDFEGNFFRVRVKVDVTQRLRNVVSLIIKKKREIFRVKYEHVPDWGPRADRNPSSNRGRGGGDRSRRGSGRGAPRNPSGQVESREDGDDDATMAEADQNRKCGSGVSLQAESVSVNPQEYKTEQPSEAMACREALSVAADLNLQNLSISSDSKQVMEDIKSDHQGSYSAIIKEIRASSIELRSRNSASLMDVLALGSNLEMRHGRDAGGDSETYINAMGVSANFAGAKEALIACARPWRSGLATDMRGDSKTRVEATDARGNSEFCVDVTDTNDIFVDANAKVDMSATASSGNRGPCATFGTHKGDGPERPKNNSTYPVRAGAAGGLRGGSLSGGTDGLGSSREVPLGCNSGVKVVQHGPEGEGGQSALVPSSW